MIRWFFQFLYGSIPVRFTSPYSTHEAMSRLSAVVKPTVLSSFAGQCAVGTVTEKNVRIQRVIPLVGNAWKPFFYGSFSKAEAGAVLEGVFKFSALTRVVMSLWFGFVSIWIILASAIALTNSPSDFWLPLLGVAMFGAGIGLVLTGKWLARNDVAWVTQVIVQTIGTNGAHPDGQAGLVHSGAQGQLR